MSKRFAHWTLFASWPIICEEDKTQDCGYVRDVLPIHMFACLSVVGLKNCFYLRRLWYRRTHARILRVHICNLTISLAMPLVWGDLSSWIIAADNELWFPRLWCIKSEHFSKLWSVMYALRITGYSHIQIYEYAIEMTNHIAYIARLHSQRNYLEY